MVKIIESNMIMDEQRYISTPMDIQSRVIEVESWEGYIDEVKLQKNVFRKSIIGNLSGETMPKSVKIEEFSANDFRLFCSFRTYDGMLMWKVAYLAENNINKNKCDAY